MPIHDQSNINLLIGILENEFNRKSVVGEKFVDFFNKRLEIYHEKRFNYADLQQMNKCILSDCYQFINRENIEIEKNTMVLKPPPSNHGFQTATDNIKSLSEDNVLAITALSASAPSPPVFPCIPCIPCIP